MKLEANSPRVGMLGFFLESNRWSPMTTAAMFAKSLDKAGEALQAELQREVPRTLPDTVGFIAEMNRSGPWTPVAIRMAAAQPGGPCEHGYFTSFLADIQARLSAAAPLDAVFISSHGAALTTQEDDPDGILFECIRRIVGPDIPLVAVLDLHTNLSHRMTTALSAGVAYKTNPHTDLSECGQESAGHLHTMLAQGCGEVALFKLPFTPPATSQSVEPGKVYAELIAVGQTYLDDDILNVSMCAGFAFADCTKCGFGVMVTARAGQRAKAEKVAKKLAQQVWQSRSRFVSKLTSLSDAVLAAVATDSTGPALILADIGDNPGGGGGGNTTTLLKALIEANARSVLIALITDPALAQEAHHLGVGQDFVAQFNRHNSDLIALPYSGQAKVIALSNGHFAGRRGLLKGSAKEMGLSALLEIGEVRVVIISNRQQLTDPAQLDALDVDMKSVRILVAKSRGHYRTAFPEFAPANRMLDVDCPGLTSPNLKSLPWTKMPRPIFPIDDDVNFLI